MGRAGRARTRRRAAGRRVPLQSRSGPRARSRRGPGTRPRRRRAPRCPTVSRTSSTSSTRNRRARGDERRRRVDRRRRARAIAGADAVGHGVADARRPRPAPRASRGGGRRCSRAGRRARATSLMPPGPVATCRSTAKARSMDCTAGHGSDQPISSGISALRRVTNVAQLLVDRVVDRRRLVLGQRALPDRVGPLRGVEPALLEPLLVAGVVGHRRAVEGVLEVGERVRRAEEVLPGPVLDDGVEGLTVVARGRRRGRTCAIIPSWSSSRTNFS